MDYDRQRAFLRRQHWRLLPSVAACVLLFAVAYRTVRPLWALVPTVLVLYSLAIAAYYLPNYLCLDVNPRRRLRWLVRARWALLVLVALLAFASGAWLALALILLAAALHYPLRKQLARAGPANPLASAPRPLGLAALYAAMDAGLLWALWRAELYVIILLGLLLLFGFFLLLLLRVQSSIAAVVSGLVATGIGLLLSPSILGAVAASLWLGGVAWLLSCAEEQNKSNYQSLRETLRGFTHEPRDTIAELLAESTRRLAESWNREQPQGQAAITAWYSRNAHLYLYDISQHHLLYKHIVYTLGLLKLARGGRARSRVFDYGGGNGDFSCALARAGVEATYLDVPGESADFLRWRAQQESLRIEIVHGLDKLRGPYDVIFALDVLEHVAEPKPVLARWKELLSPRGLLAATYYTGPASSAPMHIDPGFDVKEYLLTQGFRNVKRRTVGWFSPELLRKRHFMILEKEG